VKAAIKERRNGVRGSHSATGTREIDSTSTNFPH
jgi:hypothetical protein